ncbi:unnamed protein product [Oncorhynchus mykiss]|uniref:Voltage-dependent calcium channel gamma-7 subunit n=1 Tax=Oncorhynchus mykiss TaxID=8022 RepID=A0A060Z053_ONCMY|nr:unnamed protein product [Oncorhynchus mykiss]
MSSCSSRALTILSTVFGACGLLLVGVAVSTDYWLLMEEGIVLQQNQSMEVKMALHSGLWRVCFVAGTENGRCVASEYFTEPEIEITTENTANILSEYTVPYTYSFTLHTQHRAHQLVALKNGNELLLVCSAINGSLAKAYGETNWGFG